MFYCISNISTIFHRKRIEFSGKEHQYFEECGEMFPHSEVVIKFVTCTSLEFYTIPAFCIDLSWPYFTNRIFPSTLIYISWFLNSYWKAL